MNDTNTIEAETEVIANPKATPEQIEAAKENFLAFLRKKKGKALRKGYKGAFGQSKGQKARRN